MSEIVLTDSNFEEEVLKSDIPVLVDFWAVWCGPCGMIAPSVAAVAQENEGKLKVGKVNVDEQQRLAFKYGISSIPTLLLFKSGEIIKKTVGACSKADLDEFVKI